MRAPKWRYVRSNRVMVEVRDLDQWSTAEKVAEATAAATGITR